MPECHNSISKSLSTLSGQLRRSHATHATVCDDTQNLNETESETFFRYQIFPIPNPILVLIPNLFNTESDTFFDTKFSRYRIRNYLKIGKVSKPRSFETETSPKIPKIWTKPNPKLFAIPNFFDTESDTYFDTKFFRYRKRNHLKNGKVSKPRSFETETSHSG